MNADELESALNRAVARADWVALVARYFESHALCYGHGTDCAADEAWWLVWHLSGQPGDLAAPPADAAMRADAALPADAEVPADGVLATDAEVPADGVLATDAALAHRVAALAARRAVERIPLAYLLGSAWFAGLEFCVSPTVLIPRSPFAELIEAGFTPWIELADGDRVLEIGTGSGCIAIATAVHRPGLEVDATEIDPAALAIARDNRARHAADERLCLTEADLYPRGRARYRVIMSNPPYVPTAEVLALPPEYGHEPATALDGGADGLDVVRRILDGAGDRLTDDGVLIVEVGLAADALMAAYPRVPWTWIEFEHGGDGVFVLTADELKDGWG
jgi:ribosomal protein L3 glutamine methyltransferase